MKPSFKKQLGVVLTVLCLMAVFSVAAPALTYADSIPSPTPDIFGASNLPSVSQTSGSSNISQINNANDLTSRLVKIGTAAIYLLVAFAIVYIIYTVVIYFIKGKEGDESRREAGMRILWGIVGLFIILSLWGLVNILLNTFGTNTTLNVNSKLPQSNFVN